TRDNQINRYETMGSHRSIISAVGITKQFPVSIIIAIPQQLIEHFRFHALYFLCERAIMIAVIWFDTLLCQASYLLQEKPKLFSTKRVFLS
ncbi:MAG: hypothetical protein WBN88_21595, partial [Anderseniella sp.]